MSDGEALRRAVLADPDDDTPRLVYADWLDENGQGERAAFVRDQIDAVRAEPFSPRARAADVRAARALGLRGIPWASHLPPGVVPHFERGFVGGLTVNPDVFLPVAETVFEAEPVQSLQLSLTRTLPHERLPLAPLWELPQIRRLRRLGFVPRTEFLHDDYATLADSPHLDGLTHLSLRGSPVHPPWLRGVLAGERFPRLAGLDVADIPNLGPTLAGAFSRADHRDVRRLDVSGVVFTSDQLRQVLIGRCLKRVEELRLGWAGRGSAPGPLAQLNPGWVLPWGRLVVLDVAGQRLGSEGVQAIAREPSAASLRSLGLAKNALNPDAVRLLADAKHLNLNHLDVSGNGLAPADIALLRRRFPDALIVG